MYSLIQFRLLDKLTSHRNNKRKKYFYDIASRSVTTNPICAYSDSTNKCINDAVTALIIVLVCSCAVFG